MKKIVSCFLVGILFSLPFGLAGCTGDEGSKKGVTEREPKGSTTARVSGYQGGRKAVQQPPPGKAESPVSVPAGRPSAEGAAVEIKAGKQAKDCQKAFERCVENCRGDGCEDTCLAYLAECEAHLPKDLQMLKK